MISIIIAYHNEGQSFVEECVKQVHDTCDLDCYEVIVVDDCSAIPLQPLAATIIRNGEKLGVGGVFDKGIAAASGDDIIMMGCDVRFERNGWAQKLVADVNLHPKALICTRCITLSRDQLSLREGMKKPSGYGCNLLVRHDDDIFRAQWAAKQRDVLCKIPVIMGACYGFKKEWFEHIDGWCMYKDKGFLEGFISIKSWLFGGECLVDASIDVGHIYRERDEHGRLLCNEIYNKLLIDYWFFDSSFMGKIKKSKSLDEAILMFAAHKEEEDAKKREYVAKIRVPVAEYLTSYTTVTGLLCKR